MERRVKVALIQFEIQHAWADNMSRAQDLLERAARLGAELAVLPEMFNQPYDMALVPERAESIPGGRTCRALGRTARDLGLAVVGGSMAEKDEDGSFYNTATLWDPGGNLIARHRKVHLFDVDLPGGVSFKESDVLSPGHQVTVAEVLGLRLGLAVCYDVRFPEIFRLMALAGAEFVALPGAFNNVSGPAHWELHLRGRAVENTMYVAGVSGISPADASYQAWGHSMLVDPFGEVTTHMGRGEGLALGEIDPERLREIRGRLPVMSQRRRDLYSLKLKE